MSLAEQIPNPAIDRRNATLAVQPPRAFASL
jgi:hypothetical protein